MPRELRPLVRNWKLEESAAGVTVYSSERAVAACAGIGGRRATLATAAALSFGPAHLLISAGWAGGLHAGIAAGTAHRVKRVVDAATGEIYSAETSDAKGTTLVTANRVASLEAKKTLREQYSGDLVDMEAATVARLARVHDIPFLAVKAVSDAYDFELPGMDRYVAQDGRFREAAFAMHLAVRPHLWKAAAHMGRTSSVAAEALCRELAKRIAEGDVWGER
jgi:adenosylhomocysteine nucleosidase